MYSSNATSLLGLIRTNPALASVTGLALGGRGDDAGLVDVPVPFAWVTFIGDENTDPKKEGIVANPPTLLLKYAVIIGIPYTSEEDLLTVQYPLLRAVCLSINGQQSPTGSRWRYIGTRPPAINPDRQVFSQLYTTIASS